MVYNITHIYTYLMYIMNINQLQKKKNEVLPFVTRMNLEVIKLSEISQTQKEKYGVFTYMWNLKNKTNTTKQKQTHRSSGLVVVKGGG